MEEVGAGGKGGGGGSACQLGPSGPVQTRVDQSFVWVPVSRETHDRQQIRLWPVFKKQGDKSLL